MRGDKQHRQVWRWNPVNRVVLLRDGEGPIAVARVGADFDAVSDVRLDGYFNCTGVQVLTGTGSGALRRVYVLETDCPPDRAAKWLASRA